MNLFLKRRNSLFWYFKKFRDNNALEIASRMSDDFESLENETPYLNDDELEDNSVETKSLPEWDLNLITKYFICVWKYFQ